MDHNGVPGSRASRLMLDVLRHGRCDSSLPRHGRLVIGTRLLQWTMKALQAGKHVLIETPAALTTEDLVEITHLARQHNVSSCCTALVVTLVPAGLRTAMGQPGRAVEQSHADLLLWSESVGVNGGYIPRMLTPALTPDLQPREMSLEDQQAMLSSRDDVSG